jgi:RNA polymerase-interacting CarD/CdnL/TRCF family regulator
MKIDDVEDDYYIFQSGNTRVFVPKNQIERRGIRKPMNKEEVKKIFSLLKVPVAPSRSDAKLQYLNYKEIMKSGDPQKITKLLRDLYTLDQTDELKGKEKENTDLARRLEKAAQKLDDQELRDANKKLKEENAELKEQLTKASQTDKEAEIEAQTQRVESMDIDPEKYALGEAQRLQMDVSGFSNSLNTFIVLPDICRRMPVQYKSLIVKQALEAIERMEQVIELLKEGESELCKTA